MSTVIRSIWSDAARAGAVVGLIVVAVVYLGTWLVIKENSFVEWIPLLEVALVATCLYKFGKQRSELYGSHGFTYGQAVGYVITIMLFAGVIYGVGQYFLVNYVAKDYYDQVVFPAYFDSTVAEYGYEMAVKVEDLLRRCYASPVFWCFMGILLMFLYGIIIGLFTSAFVKRNPDIFADNDNRNE